MKKFIVLIIAALMLCSCIGGQSYRIPIKKGDVRYTVTDKQVVVEACTFVDEFGTPKWNLVRIEYRDDSDTPIEFGGKQDKLVEQK